MREDLRLRLEDGMEEELPDTPSHSMDLPNVNYCLTSVYDHTVFESMSKVIQRLLPCQFAVERILDILCQVRLALQYSQSTLLTVLGCRTQASTRLFCFIFPPSSTWAQTHPQ